MAVCLINRSHSPFVVTLYHGSYCAAGGPCKCKVRSIRRPVRQTDGTYKDRFEEERNPASLCVPANGRLMHDHDAILCHPQVKNASTGKGAFIKIIQVEASAEKPAQKAAPKPPVEPQQNVTASEEEEVDEPTPEEETAPRSRGSKSRGRNR